MHIAILTAGGAGMFCGSCMHDNTWAKALIDQQAEVTLLPTYTPIRVDEQNQSSKKVYLGGINLYLEQRSKVWRKLPRWMTRWLDWPWVIKLATKCAVSNDAKQLGELTLAMLEGEAGPQHREIDELATFLGDRLKPDVVCFSNALLVGSLRRLRERCKAKMFCVLQGDDIFLNDLPDPYREQAIQKMHERALEFDGFLVHSEYYRDYMAKLLSLPIEKFHLVPLGIDLSGHLGVKQETKSNPFTVGYFARICPEKGLQNLVAGFRLFHEKHPNTQLLAGGYLGKAHRKFWKTLEKSTFDLGDAFQYIGSPGSHAEKVTFLRSLDVLSVPTDYHEPKGLYVLEALANAVPVVQPEHGAFPELLNKTEGGLLVEPGSPEALAAGLEKLYLDDQLRQQLGEQGHANVHKHFGPEPMAKRTLEIFGSHLTQDDAAGHQREAEMSS